MSTLPVYDNPGELSEPLSSYSHVAQAGELVFVAGQCGLNHDNSVAGPDVTAQTFRAYENIAKALAFKQLSLRHVVRFVTYLISADLVPDFYAARQAFFTAHYPRGEYPPTRC